MIHVVRLRPNTYEQGRMLAEKAAKMKYVKWATIGPNYEYGKRAWETFRDRLKELKPDVQVVNEQWPTLGKIEPGPMVTAILNQNPEALYVSLFGSDWLAFVREAQKRGLFQKTFVVGILLGEPEYIDPLKLEAPEGMLVTGYPWYDISTPGPQGVGGPLHQEDRQDPGARLAHRLYHDRLGSRTPSRRRAAPRPTSSSPPSRTSRSRRRSGPSPSAPPTASPPWALGGTTKLDSKRGTGIMTNHEYVPGEKVLPSDEEVKKLRSGS
jgi:branched-chain amino acid transport system substrate-binding protein